jgi:signal transduction histidine kinase
MEELERERSEVLERRSEAMEAEILRRSVELDAANKKLRKANEQLAELDKAKTAFFSNISHEFRTPLTLLLGPAEDGLGDTREPLSPLQRERLELIHHNALRLLKLVNALLDFSRIEAGRIHATYVPTDLSRLTMELTGAFDSAVESAGLRFVVECDPLSQPAYVDRGMWEKIVLNLLSNAFKFTFEGEVAVRLREVDAHFELSVRDTGTGIPEDQLPHVFERFHRVHGARSRSFEGTGIGLSLVQELVKLHGGTVAVESVVGKGTTFTVSIPAGKAHLPAELIVSPDAVAPIAWTAAVFAEEARRWLPREPSATTQDGQSPAADEALPVTESITSEPAPADGAATRPARVAAAPARILLADDNADLRTYVTRLLAPHYAVEAVVDGQAALELALERPPDLVLSDVMMPRLDGFGLLRELRADDRTRTIPVILLSARAGEESAIEGMEAGAIDYLVKPFSARELLARVRTHLDLARARRDWASELERANRELEAFSYSVSHDLRAPLRAIDGFSQALVDEYGATLDARAREYLERVRAGARRMASLIDDLLNLSRITRAPLRKEAVDLTELARLVATELKRREPARDGVIEVAEGLTAFGDTALILIVLENLLGNAWKFTAKRKDARIAFGQEADGDETVFYVQDNGAGFDMKYADRLFAPFQRLHRAQDFEGTGVGLATVYRIIARHGGRIWAEAALGEGATFFFTLGDQR